MTYSHGLWCCMAVEHGFWFRVIGYGLHVKLAKHHRPLFSERYGYTKSLYLLGLRFQVLRP